MSPVVPCNWQGTFSIGQKCSRKRGLSNEKWMKLTAAAVAATALIYGCGGNSGGEKKADDGKNRLLWCR